GRCRRRSGVSCRRCSTHWPSCRSPRGTSTRRRRISAPWRGWSGPTPPPRPAPPTTSTPRPWDSGAGPRRRRPRAPPPRCPPFPALQSEPRSILGAGGFGVAFLCRHVNLDSPVVIKALREDGLYRDVDELFAEARVLNQLRHAAIIGLRDCDYGGGGRTRPF